MAPYRISEGRLGEVVSRHRDTTLGRGRQTGGKQELPSPEKKKKK